MKKKLLELINEYTKYLANAPKQVKIEEDQFFAALAEIDQEIKKMKSKKTALALKLSDAAKAHQQQKIVFENKLYELSKNRFYGSNKKPRFSKKHKKNSSFFKNIISTKQKEK